MEESVVGLNTDTIGIGLVRSGTVVEVAETNEADGLALMTGADCRKSMAPTATVLLPNNELLVVVIGDCGCCLLGWLPE